MSADTPSPTNGAAPATTPASSTASAATPGQGDPRDVYAGSMKENVRTIFPTPLAVHQWPDSDELNNALCELIFAEERRMEAVPAKRVGIWYTDHQFIRRDDPPIRRLRQRAFSMARAMTGATMRAGEYAFGIDGWANILRQGQYNNPHIHRRSVWSGVYYVTGNPPAVEGAPNPKTSGQIEFLDPRPAAQFASMPDSPMQRPVMLDPGAGTMILFPSWLTHMVHPYHGETPRVVVAFNVTVRRQPGKEAGSDASAQGGS